MLHSISTEIENSSRGILKIEQNGSLLHRPISRYELQNKDSHRQRGVEEDG